MVQPQQRTQLPYHPSVYSVDVGVVSFDVKTHDSLGHVWPSPLSQALTNTEIVNIVTLNINLFQALE